MGIHVKAAPGFNGWERLKDGSWKTTLPSDIEELAKAIEADKCDGCKPGFNPQHGRAYIVVGKEHVTGYSSQCQSGCRYFNPVTRQMEGRKHCSCSLCF